MTTFITNIEKYYLSIDGHEFDVVEIGPEDKKILVCETELKFLAPINVCISDYPNNLIIDIDSDTGFDTFLFNTVSISKSEEFMFFDFECKQPNKYWKGTLGIYAFLATLSEIVKESGIGKIEYSFLDGDWKELTIRFFCTEDFNFKEKIDEFSSLVSTLIKQTELTFSRAVWRKEYETNEKLYCTGILYPLLRKMGYTDVTYRHGLKEYGKDFTFSEQTKFGNLRHFGLQAKAGNLRGNVNADIDEIIGQLNDAFGMPYHEISANEIRHISTFIVAISGYFTENAKEKIIQKIPKHFLGSVYFIDRDKTNELIEKYWQ